MDTKDANVAGRLQRRTLIPHVPLRVYSRLFVVFLWLPLHRAGWICAYPCLNVIAGAALVFFCCFVV